MQRFTAKQLIGAGMCVVVLTGVLLYTLTLSGNTDTQPQSLSSGQQLQINNFVDDATNLHFDYPDTVQLGQLTAVDVQDQFIARLMPTSLADTQYLVTVRKEQGLRLAASASGQSLPDLILSNVTLSYPTRFPGFEPIRQQTLSLGGVNAAEIVFTYDSPSGATAQQHLVALAINQDEVVYFSFQALQSDFSSLESSIFEPIRSSIRFE